MDNMDMDGFSMARCMAWFDKYADSQDSLRINPAGMAKFCADIGLDPADEIMLVLAYKLQARRMGFFRSTEWFHGMQELKCDSIEKLQAKFDSLKDLFNDDQVFSEIYKFAFGFAMDGVLGGVEISMAKAMLELLLVEKWELFPQFVDFIDQSQYKVVKQDQWRMIYAFSQQFDFERDLLAYDLDDFWPTMLDDFVVWLRQQRDSKNKA